MAMKRKPSATPGSRYGVPDYCTCGRHPHTKGCRANSGGDEAQRLVDHINSAPHGSNERGRLIAEAWRAGKVKIPGISDVHEYGTGGVPPRPLWPDLDFDTYANPDSDFARAAERLAEQLRGGKNPWAQWQAKMDGVADRFRKARFVPPRVLAAPLCWRCRVALAVEERALPDGIEYTVSCHNAEMSVKVPTAMIGSAIGFGYAFQPGQTR